MALQQLLKTLAKMYVKKLILQQSFRLLLESLSDVDPGHVT